MGKRIGIMTYHRFINYGGVLQSFALARKLNEMGAEAKVLDYRCEWLENVGNSKLHCKGISVKRKALKLASRGPLIYKESRFSKFIARNIPVSDREYHSLKELETANDDYDCFITGSDQVWNPRWPFDDAYFLKFVKDPSKKYSYAASLGDRIIPAGKQDYYKKALSDFKALSVREATDAVEVSNCTGRECELHVDPVFLLESSAWVEMIKNWETRFKAKSSEFMKLWNREKEYVLIYCVNEPDWLVTKAKQYAKDNKMDIIFLNPSIVQSMFFVGKKINMASPEEFLACFYHASAVFTNSFHGTAFSIIFGKKLFVETRSAGHTNRRAENLLRLAGLEGDVLNKNTKQGLDNLDSEIKKAIIYLEGIV